MGRPLRILLAEDSVDDAELLLREIRRGGFDPVCHRVASAEEMSEALIQERWDLILSDYVMPGFGGLEALELFQQKGLDTPFIILSGHIGEELAVAAMKAGASDYIMKDRMARLVPAIERALQEADIRRAHDRANAAFRESEEKFRQLAENIGAVFFMFENPTRTHPGKLSYVSPAYEKLWGYPSETLTLDSELWLKAIHPEDRAKVLNHLPRFALGTFNEEFRIVRMDLKVQWVQFRTFPVRNEQGLIYRVAALAEDVTERKWAEEQLAANARQLETTVQELRNTEAQLRVRNDELSQARADLERRVLERTTDLTFANAELRRHIEERRRLETELLEIAENERRRIGFDLHDDIGQKLMGASLLLKALETNLANKQIPEAKDTREIQKLIHQVVNHTHDLAHCVSSLDAQGENLCGSLEELVENVRETFKIRARFRSVGKLPKISAEVAQQLYKIAQESVSNAVKHGKARVVLISLAYGRAELILRIKNDGVPFPEHLEPTRRMGLRIMNYRARTLGGNFEIHATGKSGSLVVCTIPFMNGNTVSAGRGTGAQGGNNKTTVLPSPTEIRSSASEQLSPPLLLAAG